MKTLFYAKKIWIPLIGTSLLVWIQWRVWLGGAGVISVYQLHHHIALKLAENKQLEDKNKNLIDEIQALKKNKALIEVRARMDLGMMKEGETLYQWVEDKP